ncbi:MAG: glycosyltransferase [Chloroflexi bacterium]|nr:glycosyltransferase [Chloroflexota bacterium]
MRVVMYVLNDVTRDSRVLREAGTLAAAGHEITIMATPLAGELAADGAPASEPAPPPGVAIRRIAIPKGSAWWVAAVRAPWRLHPLAALLLLPWTLARAAWVVVVNRLLGRPVRAGGIDFIRRWRVEWLGWCRAAVAAAPPADVHHAHDFEALPAAREAASRNGTRYVYDSHEIYQAWGPVLAQPRLLRAVIGRWEGRLARGAAAVVTVGQALADDLRPRLGVGRVVVVHNCPPRWDPPAVPEDRIRRALSLPPGVAVVLCHGGFMANRGLELTAEAMLEPGLEAAHLVFLGYRAGFIEPILTDARLAGRVHYLPAVAPSEVTAWVAGADVDVMAILPADLNSRLSTPNKLFESLAAGTPVVSSDLPARRAILLDDPLGPLGALCDPTSPASIASAIRSILDLDALATADLRARIRRAAHERWSWETEAPRLLELYSDMAASA